MSLNLIRASDGTGEAVRASVTAIRAPGSTTINVDAVTNWPDTFVATTGDLLASGALDPATVLVFKGSLSGATIVIDTIAPGYTDNGSAVSNVVILKPSTFWADNIRDTLAVSLDDDGTLKAGAVDNAAALANNVITTSKMLDANVTNNKLATGSGEPGGAWNSWTTTLSNAALGNGTIVSTYKQVGKTVFFKLLWTLGSTSSVSGFVSFTLPVTAASTAMDNANSIIGTVSMRDNSPSALNIGAVRYTSTTSASILRNTGDTYAAISATTPFTWATSDVLWCQGSYEAA